MRLVLIGPPGVGKGTQGVMLEERAGLKVLSSGAIFRSEIEAETALGVSAQGFLDRGELVPDEVTIAMMARRIDSAQCRDKGFLLDGFPRTIPQAEALERMLMELAMPLDRAVSLEIDDEIVVERLAGRLYCPHCGATFHRNTMPPAVKGTCDRCGSELAVRTDDHPETVRQRLETFHETTASVIDYYERRGLLRRVDGSGSPEQVYDAIRASFDR